MAEVGAEPLAFLEAPPPIAGGEAVHFDPLEADGETPLSAVGAMALDYGIARVVARPLPWPMVWVGGDTSFPHARGKTLQVLTGDLLGHAKVDIGTVLVSTKGFKRLAELLQTGGVLRLHLLELARLGEAALHAAIPFQAVVSLVEIHDRSAERPAPVVVALVEHILHREDVPIPIEPGLVPAIFR